LYKIACVGGLFLIIGVALLAGCGRSTSSGTSPTPEPLNANNVNLIFVVSEDLAYNASGDVNLSTANLTNQGLQRSLQMATFLKLQVLGRQNVTQVYTLEAMTHLQTANNYPDIAAPETIQQFALLNQITLSLTLPPVYTPYTGNSYPLNASYAPGSVPSGVATPSAFCAACQGLDFNDQRGNNEALLTGIIAANVPGNYLFSAPWETASALLANINRLEGYNLTLPTSYAGPDYIDVISIAPSGSASLVTYNSNLNPGSGYPVLPSPALASTPCAAQTPFVIEVIGGSGGAVIPEGINTNETLYILRHADAHPQATWSDGNYICAGQWRALDLPNALRGKFNPQPQQIYSLDPAQTSPGIPNPWSAVAPSLTIEPYAIANGLPYGLVASFDDSASNADQLTSNFFFTSLTGQQFSNRTMLLAWSYEQIPPAVQALVSSYYPHGGPTPVPVPDWPGTDYDTIWTVRLDGQGNLTVNNTLCEGIDSAALPATCPQF
jgi:hypothetical protein